MAFKHIVPRDVGGRTKRPSDAREQPAAHAIRVALAVAVDPEAEEDVTPARKRIGELLRKHVPRRIGKAILGGHGRDIRRRPLKHGDVCGPLGEFGHEGNRRRPAADDDHSAPLDVQIRRPRLRMDDAAFEVAFALERGTMSAAIAVIAGADHQEAAAVHPQVARAGADALHVPMPGLSGPGGSGHPPLEADAIPKLIFVDHLAHVAKDRRPVGDRLGIRPGFELIAQGVHVAVRPDPGISKQVPGAADVLPRLEDGERL